MSRRLDVINPGESESDTAPMDAALQMIISERDRVGWWQRRPAYMDVVGLTQVPAGVDVRRFVDSSGINLFVIDNWQQQTGKQFLFNGTPVPIPAERVKIVVGQ